MTSVALQSAAPAAPRVANDRRRIVPAPVDFVRPVPVPLLAATRIHPYAVALPLVAYSWLIFGAWAAFAGGETSLALVFVTLISVMFLGLMLLPAVMGRNMQPERAQDRSFRAFMDGDVDIATGRISGRAAFWQIATLAISLAIGGTAILFIAHAAAVAAGPTI